VSLETVEAEFIGEQEAAIKMCALLGLARGGGWWKMWLGFGLVDGGCGLGAAAVECEVRGPRSREGGDGHRRGAGMPLGRGLGASKKESPTGIGEMELTPPLVRQRVPGWLRAGGPPGGAW
jgi:hypothetical protein